MQAGYDESVGNLSLMKILCMIEQALYLVAQSIFVLITEYFLCGIDICKQLGV